MAVVITQLATPSRASSIELDRVEDLAAPVISACSTWHLHAAGRDLVQRGSRIDQIHGNRTSRSGSFSLATIAQPASPLTRGEVTSARIVSTVFHLGEESIVRKSLSKRPSRVCKFARSRTRQPVSIFQFLQLERFNRLLALFLFFEHAATESNGHTYQGQCSNILPRYIETFAEKRVIHFLAVPSPRNATRRFIRRLLVPLLKQRQLYMLKLHETDCFLSILDVGIGLIIRFFGADFPDKRSGFLLRREPVNFLLIARVSFHAGDRWSQYFNRNRGTVANQLVPRTICSNILVVSVYPTSLRGQSFLPFLTLFFSGLSLRHNHGFIFRQRSTQTIIGSKFVEIDLGRYLIRIVKNFRTL